MPAEVEVEQIPEGYVERSGPIFEAGEYEDKAFSLSLDELQAAVSNFKPVELELEHYDTQGQPNILSGKLGRLVETHVGQDGKTLMGKTLIPEWLHKLYEGQPIKVSAVWRQADKVLERAGLVLNPRVPSAAIFTAYAQFAGQRHSAADLKDLQAIHDTAVKQGAVCAQTTATMTATQTTYAKETRKMGVLDDIKALLSKHNVPFSEEGAGDTATPPESGQNENTETTPATNTTATSTTTKITTTTPGQAADQADPEKAALFSRIERMEQQAREKDAQAFLQALITGGKLMPKDQGVALASFTRALEDDAKDPQVVTFSDAAGAEVKLSRTDLVKAQYEARPSHGLFGQHVPSVVFALPTQGGGEKSEFEKAREDAQKFLDRNYASNGTGK